MGTSRAHFMFSLSAGVVLLLTSFSWADEPAKAASAKPKVSPSAAPAARSGTALRDEIRSFLRDVARQPGKPDDAVIRRAVALYREVQADTQLRLSQREPLRIALRNKLTLWGEQLRAAQADKPAPLVAAELVGAAPASVERPKPLAQAPGQIAQPGQMPGGTGRPPVDHGQELLELIQDTIAPSTWDVRGGNGVVRYWAPGHALIVRQTGEVHEQLGRLLNDMR